MRPRSLSLAEPTGWSWKALLARADRQQRASNLVDHLRRAQQMGAMTGNPHDCRLRAVECWSEAEFARTAPARATLEQFAKLWLDLAAAYEREHELFEKWGETPAPISAIYPTALR